MRTCSKCGKRYRDYEQRNSFCRPCKRFYDREYHKTRTSYEKGRKQFLQEKRKRNIRLSVRRYKASKGCAECSETDPIVLELDHRDRNDKTDHISQMITRGMALVRIMVEVKKCDVVCANCHRRRTAKQLNWYQE